jgi:hypothetical protein
LTVRQPIEKRTVLLRGEEQRQRALLIVQRMPIDPERPIRVVIDDPLPAKSREQEEKYHAMIGDIANQYEHAGRKWDLESMKRILLEQFRRDTVKDTECMHLWASIGQLEMAPSLDGSGVVVLGVQSRKFPMKLASLFVEWLYALGCELNIKWSEPRGK